MNNKLTQWEYENKLRKIYPDIYRKIWPNLPESTFYYSIPNFNGITDPIGIYTSETNYQKIKE